MIPHFSLEQRCQRPFYVFAINQPVGLPVVTPVYFCWHCPGFFFRFDSFLDLVFSRRSRYRFRSLFSFPADTKPSRDRSVPRVGGREFLFYSLLLLSGTGLYVCVCVHAWMVGCAMGMFFICASGCLVKPRFILDFAPPHPKCFFYILC